MKNKIEDLKLEYFDQAIQSTLDLIKIPSEQGKPVENARFGEQTLKALKYVINLGNKWGMETYIDPEGYYGFVQYGKGKEVVLIAPHLDVVTAGNLDKWDFNPYKPFIKDEKIFGRGAIDDKGPAMMAFYAMRYLKDSGFKPKNRIIRIVFGLNEEKSMKCIKKYVDDFEAPLTEFTPDGAFPCIYAEKATVNIDIIRDINTDYVLKRPDDIQDYNVVIDHIIYQGNNISEIQNYLNSNSIETKIDEDVLHIFGKPAHGSMPELGVNAVLWTFKAINFVNPNDKIAKFVTENFFDNYDLNHIVGDISDESGSLSTCVGYINVSENQFRMGINFRVPATKTARKYLVTPLSIYVEKNGFKLKVKDYLPEAYFGQEMKIVKTMIDSYQKITGITDLLPHALGSGSYAKFVPNLISAGIVDDESNLSMHQYNEWVAIDKLKNAYLIYIDIIEKLSQ